MWSNNADVDDYGFRKLSMPKAKCLVSLNNQIWVAQTENGKWYGCHRNNAITAPFGIKDFRPLVPTEIPLDDITEVAYGTLGGTYCCFLDSEDNCRAYRVGSTASAPIILPNVKKLSSDNSYQYAIIDKNGDRIVLNTSSGAISKGTVGL